MDSTTYEHGVALSDCVAVLDTDDQHAVEAYWDHVIAEVMAECEPSARVLPRAVPLPEDERRARRQARRAMARVAAASRLATVVEIGPVGLVATDDTAA